jgi:hypothetical protein
VRWLDRERGVSTLEARLEDTGFDPTRFEEDQTEFYNGGALCQIFLVGYKRQNGNGYSSKEPGYEAKPIRFNPGYSAPVRIV